MHGSNQHGRSNQAWLGSTPRPMMHGCEKTPATCEQERRGQDGGIIPSHMQRMREYAWWGGHSQPHGNACVSGAYSPPPHMQTITARCMAGEFSRTQNKLMLDDGWSLLAGHARAPRERSRSASSSRSSNFIPCRGFDGMLVLVSQAETLAACSMGAFKYAPIYYAQLAFARAPT